MFKPFICSSRVWSIKKVLLLIYIFRKCDKKRDFDRAKLVSKLQVIFLQKKTLIKKIHQRGENDTFFLEQTLYWFVMKDRQSSDPWGHKWCFERHFSWQVVHFQLSNWQGHRWAGLLMISQINQSKPIELRNQELLICYFVFLSYPFKLYYLLVRVSNLLKKLLVLKY